MNGLKGSGCGCRRPVRVESCQFSGDFGRTNGVNGGFKWRSRVIPLAIFAVCACGLNDASAQSTGSAAPSSGAETNPSQTGAGSSSLPSIVVKPPPQKARQAKRKEQRPVAQATEAAAQSSKTDAELAAIQAAAHSAA